MNRRAPVGGYIGGRKQHYRRQLWKSFSDHCGTGRSAAHALLMPSAEGTEITVAEQHGFRQDHLHIVDRNPAIVAHLKRRFPRVNTYGLELVRALDRMRKNGVILAIANFDLCGHIGSTFPQLKAISAMGVLRDDAMIAVTLLRGREPAGHLARLRAPIHRELDVSRSWLPREATETDMVRIGWAGAAFADAGLSAHPRRVGIYRSTAGSQTMLWFVLTFTRWGA